MTDAADSFAREQAEAEAGGGSARQARHKRLGRMTARERILALLEPDSFVELGRHTKHRHAASDPALAAVAPPGDGLIAGLGRVAGQTVAVYAHDPTVLRGALGHAAAQKLCRLLDLAAERGLPVIAFVDCDGVRIAEGTDAIDAYGAVIDRTIALRGKVPQLTVVCGLCVGAAAYNAALTDLVCMVREQSFMFITGPKVTEVVTGEAATMEGLGGASVHGKTTGSAHATVADESAAVVWVKRMLDAWDPAPRAVTEPQPPKPLSALVPVEPRRGYDVKKVVAALVDADSFEELGRDFAPNLVTGFARIAGRPAAVVASQPMHRAGCLDIASSQKGAHFVRFAARRGLPIVTLVDVPGYVPGVQQEHGGILREGASLLAAYGEVSVPKICVVLRKSYGGANVLSYAADYRFALPMASAAPMGADAAADVLLGVLTDESSEEQRAAHADFKASWRSKYESVWPAAHAGYVDKVVEPDSLRAELCRLFGLI